MQEEFLQEPRGTWYGPNGMTVLCKINATLINCYYETDLSFHIFNSTFRSERIKTNAPRNIRLV